MPSDYRTPTVTSIGGRDGAVRSADGLIDLQVALPTELGGPGSKTNPEELFAAGYAACFHSAVKGVAAAKKIAIGKSIVEANVSLDLVDNGPRRKLGAELHVILPGADVDAARDVVRGAHELCPYSNATRNNITVQLSVTDPNFRASAAPVEVRTANPSPRCCVASRSWERRTSDLRQDSHR